MKIKDMFLKDINRNIEGVITASKAKDDQVYQELDEYVVTKELQGHFKTFFDAYKKGVLGETSKMGVWIQGFFGSGKSHFLKIISYILENKEVYGKTAFDFFTEGDEFTRKIIDDMTIADMELATNTPTNVILFNVESKHQTGVEEKNSLVNVFLKVFNDSLGYSTNPKVADLERRLDRAEKYEEFQLVYKKERGIEWIADRHEVDFIQDPVVKTLVEIDYMSEDAAKTWFNKLESEYILSIEEFAIMVEEYLQAQGNNKHIIFLVDEIGQYIGGNSDLTLQLQTIIEELGNKSRGKAWVIVTSQQAIDKITDISEFNALDFSKIKARFETTLSLSSANADEVIQKRILAKNSSGQDYLEADYPNYKNDINSIFVFEDSPELKIYNSAKEYADIYPFVPYQFNLLANILTQISKHSIQGANLSRGERSLLAFFKETAERNAKKESEILISLDQFYPSLEKWLNESDNIKVIKQAEENTRIMPDTDDQFNINVLKVLFMIKYVDQNIKPTLNNITNLMIRRVNEDKLKLRKKVENALSILISENLIRQNLQSYVFQTDEEQEVTRLINNIELTTTDVEHKLAIDIFDGKVGQNRFAYKNKHAIGRALENRYHFGYNLFIDDYAYRKNSNPNLEVKVIIPYYDAFESETELILRSTQNQMLVKLPLDKEFMDNVRTYMKVEKYITTANVSSAIRNFASVKAEKMAENQELSESIDADLDSFLKQAIFYFNNQKIEVIGNDFKSRLNDALQQMARLVYHKNDLIDSAISEAEIYNLLSSDDDRLAIHNENQHVVEEVKRHIQLQQSKNLTVTMKTLRDHFVTKEPYGFINEDLEWVIARLFKEGNINLFVNGISLSINGAITEISKSIFERKNPGKIRIELRQKSNESQKKLVKELSYELFDKRNVVDKNNDDTTRSRFNELVKQMIDEFEGYNNIPDKNYPQSSLISESIKMLQLVIKTRDTKSFFEILKNKENELLDWAEDLEDIRTFHKGSQKQIWDDAIKYISRIEDSTIKASTEEINVIVENMKKIMRKSVPYREISRLSELNTQFTKEYLSFIEARSDIASKKIQVVKQDVLNDITIREISDDLKPEILEAFDDLIEDLNNYHYLDQIELAPVQAEELKTKFFHQFTQLENINREKKQGTEKVDEIILEVPVSVPKKIEQVYIRTLIDQRTRIKSIDDIDRFVNNLKQELLNELNDDNEIDILL